MPHDSFHFLLFVGRTHPLIVHLPIGFLTVLVGIELLHRMHRFNHVGAARGVVLAMTVASSIGAVAAGLALSTAGGYDPSLLAWHKWMGIALAVFVTATAVAFYKHNLRLYGGLLLLTLAVMAPASHFGGSITHGENYLTEYAPAWFRSKPVVPITTRPTVTDARQAKLYGDVVQPVLIQSCVGCHGTGRSSGSLRMDTVAALLRGGASGPAAFTGRSDDSLLFKRMLLPATDPKHMPPADKPQPTDDQITLVRWWIDSGLSESATVGDLKPSTDQLKMVATTLHVAVPVDPSERPPLPVDQLPAALAALPPRQGLGIAPVYAGSNLLAVNASTCRGFDDAALQSLEPIATNIQSLDLAGTKITDAAMTTVAAMSNLQRLRLERTAVTDAGVARLAGLPKLSYLNLYGTAVSAEGLNALRSIKSLSQVYLWNTRVDPDAAKAFAESRVDPLKTRQWEKQIAELQEKIRGQHITVVGASVKPSTRPTTKPVMVGGR